MSISMEKEANSYLFETGKINRERDQKFISLGAEYFIDDSSSFTIKWILPRQ